MLLISDNIIVDDTNYIISDNSLKRSNDNIENLSYYLSNGPDSSMESTNSFTSQYYPASNIVYAKSNIYNSSGELVFQGPVQGNGHHCCDDAVDGGHSALLGDGEPHSVQRDTHDKIIFDKALAQIQDHIGNSTQHRRKDGLPVTLLAGFMGDAAADKGHEEFKRKGEGGGGDVQGIGQVKEGGADAGCQTALDRPQKQAGQQAHHIAHVQPGGADGCGNMDLQKRRGHIDQRRHDADKGGLPGGDFLHEGHFLSGF